MFNDSTDELALEEQLLGLVANMTQATRYSHQNLGIVLFLFAFCLAIVLGLLLMSCCRMSREQHLPLNYGALLLIISSLLGALFAKYSASNLKLSSHMQILLNNTSTMVLYHLASPVLCFYSSYIIPMHLLTLTRLRNICFYTLVSIFLPSFVVAVAYRAMSTVVSGEPHWSIWVDDRLVLAWFMIGAGAMMGESVTTGYHMESMGRTGDLLLFLEGEFMIVAGVTTVCFTGYREVAGQGLPVYIVALNLLSLPLVLAIGEFCLYIMKRLHRNKIRNTLIFIVSVYLAHLIPEACSFSGPGTVCLLGAFFSRNTMNIDSKIVGFLEEIFRVFYFGATHFIYFLSGFHMGHDLYQNSEWLKEIHWVLLLALLCFVLRVIGVLYCWMSNTYCSRQESTLMKELVKIFGNISGPLCLLIGLAYVSFVDTLETRRMFFYLTSIVICSVTIKGSLFPLLTYHLCINRQEIKAMHLKSLKEKLREVQRLEMLSISQDRFLTEARWDLVGKAYKEIPRKSLPMELPAKVETYMMLLLQKLHVEPDVAESTIHRKIRVAMLRAQQASYLRHHQESQLSTWAMRLLMSATGDTLNARDVIISVNRFKHYLTMSRIWKKARRIFRGIEAKLKIHVNELDHPPEPHIRFRQFFYYLDHSIVYEACVYLVLLTHMAITFAELPHQTQPHKYGPSPYAFVVMNKTFYSFYIAEFLVTLIGLGRNVFHTKWNYLDCAFAIISAIDLVFELFLFKVFKKHKSTIRDIQLVLLIIRMCKLVRFVRILIPALVRWCEVQMNRKLTKSYEILRGLICAEDDALRAMDYIVETELSTAERVNTKSADLSKIVHELRSAHKHNRMDAVREMTRLTTKHMKVMCAVKTKQSLFYLFETLRRKVEDWRTMGEIDHGEYHYMLHHIIKSEAKALKKIKPSVKPPDLQQILEGIFWIDLGGKPVEQIVMKEGIRMKLHEGEVLFEQGSTCEQVAMYIVISGMLKLSITLDEHHVFEEYFGTSTSMGEMSLLTGDPRSGQVCAFTDTDLLVIPAEVCYGIFKNYPEVKEAMIHKYCTRKVYSDIFVMDPRYRGFTEARIKACISEGEIIDLLDEQHRDGYYRRSDDDFLILVRGSCCVDRNDAHPAQHDVFVRKHAYAKILPHACTHVKPPPPSLSIPGDQVWLLAMPKPDAYGYQANMTSLSSTVEMLNFERKSSTHMFEIPHEIADSISSVASLPNIDALDAELEALGSDVGRSKSTAHGLSRVGEKTIEFTRKLSNLLHIKHSTSHPKFDRSLSHNPAPSGLVINNSTEAALKNFHNASRVSPSTDPTSLDVHSLETGIIPVLNGSSHPIYKRQLPNSHTTSASPSGRRRSISVVDMPRNTSNAGIDQIHHKMSSVEDGVPKSSSQAINFKPSFMLQRWFSHSHQAPTVRRRRISSDVESDVSTDSEDAGKDAPSLAKDASKASVSRSSFVHRDKSSSPAEAGDRRVCFDVGGVEEDGEGMDGFDLKPNASVASFREYLRQESRRIQEEDETEEV